jgi:hypothetical protein
MLGPHRGSVQGQHSPTLEDPVDNRVGQIVIVQHAAPRIEGFVGRENHRPPFPMAVIDHVEEHVGRIGPVGEIADFVDLCGAPHKSTNATSAVMWSEAAITGVKRTAIRIPTPHYW